MNYRPEDASDEQQPSPVSGDAPDPASPASLPRSAAPRATMPAGAGWSRRELLAVAVAVVLGGAATSAWLMTQGDDVPPAATASAAASGSAPAGSATPAIRAKWSTDNVAQWVGNGRVRFAVQLQAENSVAVWQRQVRPVLVVRCIGQGLETFVYTNSAARMEPRTEDHTVRITLDGGDEVSERWPDSADHDALFAPDGAAFARQLIGARTLQFGFTPHNAPAVVAHFNVAGLDAALAPAAKQCGLK